MRLRRDAWEIQNEVVAAFLINFKDHMNILFISKVKILLLIRWSHKSRRFC